MKIAVAQIRPKKGDISTNVKKHLQLIQLAIHQKADAIFFSELSLTGYEPKLASEVALSSHSPTLKTFQQISDQKNITVWDNKGRLLAQLDSDCEGILVYDTQSQKIATAYL